MIQFIKDRVAGLKNRLLNLWQGRFQFGADVRFFTASVNRFTNGQKAYKLTVCQIVSSGTGHWPFSILDVAIITGERAAFHVTVLGYCVGTLWQQDLNEDGTICGPDHRIMYSTILCINHQNKQLEEVI